MPRDFDAEQQYRQDQRHFVEATPIKFPLVNTNDIIAFIQRKLESVPEIANSDKFVISKCNWFEIQNVVDSWKNGSTIIFTPKSQTIIKVIEQLEQLGKIKYANRI